MPSTDSVAPKGQSTQFEISIDALVEQQRDRFSRNEEWNRFSIDECLNAADHLVNGIYRSLSRLS